MKSLFLSVCLLGSFAFAAVDCPSNYPNGATMTYSDGSMNFPNGATLRYRDGSMNYPNGGTLRYRDGSMNYQNGASLMYSDGSMNYPNGATLRYKDGSLNNENGSTNQTGSVRLSTSFGTGNLQIIARKAAVSFTATIAYGNGIAYVEFDTLGNVTCTVEGGGSGAPTEFKIEGAKGTAFVTVKAGENAAAIKQAVQKAMDGN